MTIVQELISVLSAFEFPLWTASADCSLPPITEYPLHRKREDPDYRDAIA